MFFVLACLLLTAPDAPAEVQTLGGEVVRGTLVELNERQIIVSTIDKQKAAKQVIVPVADLQQIRLADATPPAKPPVAWIELTDGSLLLAAECTVKAGACRIVLGDGSELKLPVRAVRSVRFQDQTAALAAEWAKIRARQATSDLAVLRKKERLDFIEGVLKEIDDQAAVFHMDGEDVRISRTKLEGLILFPSKQEQLASAAAIVVGRDGSRFQASKFSLADGQLTLSTPSGAQLARPLISISQLDFASGKVIYLSDLEPQLAQWSPYFPAGKLSDPLGRLFRPRRNQALLYGETAGDDGALLLRFPGENGLPNIRPFAKGLALHSRSRVQYELTESFRQFTAIAGIDARLGQQGNVRLLIEGDGRELFSASITGHDAPRPIHVDLKGVKQLVLTVDFGQQLDVGDYLNLCDARLVR